MEGFIKFHRFEINGAYVYQVTTTGPRNSFCKLAGGDATTPNIGCGNGAGSVNGPRDPGDVHVG